MGLAVSGVADRQFLWRMRMWDPRCTVQVSLRRGDDVLDQVSCLKRHLQGRGLPASRDSRFGVDTVRAVRALGRAEGRPVDGIADSRLLKHLGAWSEPSHTRPPCTVSSVLRPGQRGQEMGCLRARLVAAGYRITERPRICGDRVAKAVRHWKRRRGLNPDDVAGEMTLRSLRMWLEP